MATIGGNLLRRTRCRYFRDPTVAACNKRQPGTPPAGASAPCPSPSRRSYDVLVLHFYVPQRRRHVTVRPCQGRASR
jgi:hypothetical protein